VTPNQALLTHQRNKFHAALNETVHFRDKVGVMTNADKDNVLSKKLAHAIAQQLGKIKTAAKPQGQTLGKRFEKAVRDFVKATFTEFDHVRPGPWQLVETAPEDAFYRTEQYSHLKDLAELIKQYQKIQASIGNSYVITHDILVLRQPWTDIEINKAKKLVDEASALGSSLRKDFGAQESMHASVSCKWTLRSDRAQNARTEALNLIRNRKGQTPHIVVVTAEPMPSRLASLALGTGDIDCVYHFALPELKAAVEQHGNEDSTQFLSTMIVGKRLKDISDLPLDLAI
jgi:hypothetical protein